VWLQLLLCVFDNGGQDLDELTDLVRKFVNFSGAADTSGRQQSQPIARFASFLAGNGVLGNKVSLALSRLSFLYVGADRSPTS